MIRILGLMTCYNRKEKTISAIKKLIEGNPRLEFSFIVADDGSTDGTSESLKEINGVKLLHGDGTLFYSGGMRLAIEAAKMTEDDYDYCLMFNDDVDFYPEAIEKLCEKNQDMVWVGPTCNEERKMSYGGIVKVSKIRPKTKTVKGCACDTFNANCVLIPWKVFSALDNIDPVFTHSMGDFDYGFSIGRKGYTICVAEEYVGICENNPVAVSWRNIELSRKERLKRKESPKGLPTKEWFHYLNKNYNFVTAIIYSIIPFLRIILKR